MINKIIFKCNSCNKKIIDYKSNRQSKKVYCSRKCFSKSFIGKPSWNKGIPHTKEHKNKLKRAKENEKERPLMRTGNFVMCSCCNKKTYKEKNWFEKDLKPYCSQICFGKIKSRKQIDSIKKIGLNNKGKIYTLEHKNKISKKRKKLIREGKIRMEFPKEDTKIEVKVQNFLKTLEIDFFTHQYMKIDHGYLCDVFIPSMNLVIECDGDYWHKYPTGMEIDHIRTRELIEKGFKVLRLWENEIKVMNVKDFQRRINQ